MFDRGVVGTSALLFSQMSIMFLFFHDMSPKKMIMLYPILKGVSLPMHNYFCHVFIMINVSFILCQPKFAMLFKIFLPYFLFRFLILFFLNLALNTIYFVFL